MIGAQVLDDDVAYLVGEHHGAVSSGFDPRNRLVDDLHEPFREACVVPERNNEVVEVLRHKQSPPLCGRFYQPPSMQLSGRNLTTSCTTRGNGKATAGLKTAGKSRSNSQLASGEPWNDKTQQFPLGGVGNLSDLLFRSAVHHTHMRPSRAVLRGLLGRRKEGVMPVMTTVPELARQMRKDASRLYELAKRDDDPLPLRYIDGERYGSVLVSEFEDWFKRNASLANERRS